MSKPLSEELRDLAVDGEKLAAQMYTGPTTLRRWADRAAALEREAAELHALREVLAAWWDPVGVGPDGWTAENAEAWLTHLQRNIDAMREAIEERLVAMREVIEEAGSDE